MVGRPTDGSYRLHVARCCRPKELLFHSWRGSGAGLRYRPRASPPSTALQPRVEPGRAAVGAPARPLAQPPRARLRLRGPGGRGMRGVERALRLFRAVELLGGGLGVTRTAMEL